MKKLRTNIDRWFESLDYRWDQIPEAKQQKIILRFFAVYVILTAAVIINVWQDTSKADNEMNIKYIESPFKGSKGNPSQTKDTLSVMIKNKIYEKK
jgi:hypothetical protein